MTLTLPEHYSAVSFSSDARILMTQQILEEGRGRGAPIRFWDVPSGGSGRSQSSVG